jgi:hypothetical protein
MLSLSEKLLLIGLHDEKGSVVFSASLALPYGLAGALLLELYLSNRIDFVNNRVKVISKDKTGNALSDEALVLISSSPKLRDAKHWLNTIHSKVKNVQQRLAEQLVQKGVLSKQEQRFLWIFSRDRYPTHDAKPEQAIRDHIKDVVLNSKPPTEEDVAIVSLIDACELVNEVFDSSDRRRAKERIKKIGKDEKISQAISQTVEEIQVALIILITATTVTTTVAT